MSAAVDVTARSTRGRASSDAEPAGARAWRPWSGEGPRILRVFLASWVLLAALMSTWALASPLMAAPDEPAHTVRAAAVVRGQIVGETLPGVGGDRVFVVPDYIAHIEGASYCFALRSLEPATCGEPVEGSNDTAVAVTSSAGTYNPLYYALVGWPTLIAEDAPAIYGMRLAASVLCSAVLASGFAAIAARRRSSWSFGTAAIAVTPMVLFLGSSINISGLEVAAGFAVTAWLALVLDPGRRVPLWAAITGVVVTGVLLANTRSVGPLWLAVIAVVMLMDARVWSSLVRSRAFWIGVLVIGAVAAAAAVWALTQGGEEVRDPGKGAGEMGFRKGAEFMLSHTLDNADGYVGTFGWLDARLPDTTVNVWGGLMFAAVAAAIVLGRGWGRIRTIAMLLAYTALPAIIQGYSWNTHGYIWQTRYILAIVLALLVVAGATLDDALPPISEVLRGATFTWTLLGGLLVMHAFALAWNLRRYVTGLDDEQRRWSIMLTAPSWQPPFTWEVLLAAFTAIAALGLWLIGRRMLGRPAFGRGTLASGEGYARPRTTER